MIREMQYDGLDLIAEYNDSGTLTARYVHGPGADEPLVQYAGTSVSTRQWLLADERGSIVAVTDWSGAAIQINSYDEYGAPAPGNAGRFGYTGQVWLPETGLYHYKNRAYNPELGRFMQTDPIGVNGGMNLYAYVGGDPVNFVDPLGLWRVMCRQMTTYHTRHPEPGVIISYSEASEVCFDLGIGSGPDPLPRGPGWPDGQVDDWGRPPSPTDNCSTRKEINEQDNSNGDFIVNLFNMEMDERYFGVMGALGFGLGEIDSGEDRVSNVAIGFGLIFVNGAASHPQTALERSYNFSDNFFYCLWFCGGDFDIGGMATATVSDDYQEGVNGFGVIMTIPRLINGRRSECFEEN